MPFKPLKRRVYEKWISSFGWSLQKGSIDWNLLDESGNWVCSIKITHPGNEIPPRHVVLTEKRLKERGFKP